MMVIENKYEIGDCVYLVTDKEQSARLIVAIIVYKSGDVMYKVISGTEVSEHFDFELSDTKNILIDV